MLPKTSVLALALLLGNTGPARAEPGTVDVTVTNIRNARGHIVVALCDRAHFVKPGGCAINAKAPARPGAITVHVTGVPPGTYAAQVFHDENDNGEVDRNFLGIPTEGLAFSNDAPAHFGPPSFNDAAFTVGPNGGAIHLALWYLL